MGGKALVGYGDKIGVVDVRYLGEKARSMRAEVCMAFHKEPVKEAIADMAKDAGVELMQCDDPSEKAHARASELREKGDDVLLRDLSELRDIMRDAF
jgi:predicted peroxiredoxin